MTLKRAHRRKRFEISRLDSVLRLEAVPEAFEITAHKGKYQAINPAQVVLCR